MPIQITGNLVNAYYLCKRKFWLYAHQFNPDPENDLLLLGKIISEETYSREKKEVLLEGMKIDLLKRNDENIIVCEIKKSSKSLLSAKMQLAYYIKRLKEFGIHAKGEILIPKENKKLNFELTPEIEEELEKGIEEMKRLSEVELPPPVKKTSYCKNCGFSDFCFA